VASSSPREKPLGRKRAFSEEQAGFLQLSFDAWKGTKVDFAKLLGVSKRTIFSVLWKYPYTDGFF